jgi:hypothetical protein
MFVYRIVLILLLMRGDMSVRRQQAMITNDEERRCICWHPDSDGLVQLEMIE